MRRWLARLSFSFFILGGVLLWDASRSSRGAGRPISPRQIQLQYAAAGVCIALGFLGTRERHRLNRQREPHEGE